MTDDEINYQSMARQVLRLLTERRPDWEPVYGKLMADYKSLEKALKALDEKAQQRSGTSARGYADAKDQAEVAALDAAMPVVQGLKALYLDGEHPALGKVAAYTRTALDHLRDMPQVAALENLYELAEPLAAELADELVTAGQLQALKDRVAAFRRLVGAPRQQTTTGSTLREAAVRHLAEARAAIKRLDVRVPNLQATLPDLVDAYRKARIIVDAGHGPGPAAPKA